MNLNNDTTLQSSANESIERKIAVDAVNKTNLDSHATITDEKPVKNLSNVFRDIDAKKIQSNAKDIEDESTNILQSRRNTQTDLNTSTSTITSSSTSRSTTTTTSEPTAEKNTNSILSFANDASTTEQTNLPPTNQADDANIQAEVMPKKHHRRHRQQR